MEPCGDEDGVFMNVIHGIVLITHHFINGEMPRSGKAERGGRSRGRDVMWWKILVKEGGLVSVIARESVR